MGSSISFTPTTPPPHPDLLPMLGSLLGCSHPQVSPRLFLVLVLPSPSL